MPSAHVLEIHARCLYDYAAAIHRRYDPTLRLVPWFYQTERVRNRYRRIVGNILTHYNQTRHYAPSHN